MWIVEHYETSADYLAALEARGTLPPGFAVATAATAFEPPERPGKELPLRVTLLLAERPTDAFAATLTRNTLRGAPVQIVADLLTGRVPVRGVLINNAVANVGVASGVDDAMTVVHRLAEHAGAAGQAFAPASTGVIGWRLPFEPICAALPGLVAACAPGSAMPAARAIMTTDRYPKVRSRRVGAATVVGIAKGAGMIEPSMATMLAFLLTDAAVDRDTLQRLLSAAVRDSFNRISVDGDQSTSDMVLALSSQRAAGVPEEALGDAIAGVCRDLAGDIVRNGEGVEHVIRVTVRAPGTDEEAAAIGKAIVNSPLVKTAVNGCDPNVGRIVSAAGDHLGAQPDPPPLAGATVRLGGVTVYSRGAFQLDGSKEAALAAYLQERRIDHTLDYPPHDRTVEIEVDFEAPAAGRSAHAVVQGADLSHGYVTENADYRS
jgi:glutamate N-acetyltransferase/amino-acid N-acetyltransferase